MTQEQAEEMIMNQDVIIELLATIAEYTQWTNGILSACFGGLVILAFFVGKGDINN